MPDETMHIRLRMLRSVCIKTEICRDICSNAFIAINIICGWTQTDFSIIRRVIPAASAEGSVIDKFRDNESGMKMNRETKNLYKKVNKFRKWAQKHFPECDEEHDNGEWEFGVDSLFDEMVSAAGEVILHTDHEDADEDLIDAMLYVVARDNECENLADILLKHEGWFSLLATRSLDSKYINAQWQFAKRVGEIECCKMLVYEFIESDNEYTSRMALQTLADISPDKAEEYAELF